MSGKINMKANVIQLENTAPREKWVTRISTAWRENLTSIFETGNLLEAAKAELKHGEWTAMFQNGELPFDKKTAERLIAISTSDNVRNGAISPHLPIAWTVLYELTKLTDEQFANGIESRAINPQMRNKDVKALRGITIEVKFLFSLVEIMVRCSASCNRRSSCKPDRLRRSGPCPPWRCSLSSLRASNGRAMLQSSAR
jgi:hypothetical protein